MSMRYDELSIETQRQAPARARTEGTALLRRAGYIGPNDELTALGRRTRTRLEELAETRVAAEFFGRLELPVVEAQGGDWFIVNGRGRSEVATCSSCGYAAARPLAKVRKATPPPQALEAIEKVVTPECHTIDALARFLGLPKDRTAKALMYTRTADNKFVFVVIRGDMQLSEKKLKQALGDFRAATIDEIRGAGAAPGYASPIGLKDVLVAVDDLIPSTANLVAGANESGYHFKNTNYGRDYTAEVVADLVLAETGALCINCGSPLSIMNADLLKDNEGYCFGELLEALAEIHHDEKGLALPLAAAPFDIFLLHLTGKEMDTRGQATQLHDTWEAAGISVLLDDRDERAGVKFADADLIGCPVRATVGEKSMRNGMVELKARTSSESTLVAFADALNMIRTLSQRTS